MVNQDNAAMRAQNAENRNKLIELLDLQLGNCRQRNHNLTYAIINIDEFNKINATYGAAAGRAVLNKVSELLHDNLSNHEHIVPDGSNSFVIFFPAEDEKSALAVLENIREEFAANATKLDSVKINATFSGGIASFPNFSESQNLIEAADKALQYSKHHRRNLITIWDAHLHGSF